EKRVAVAAVAPIEQLAQAVGTGGRIGRNARAHPAARLAGHDAKFFFFFWRNRSAEYRVDPRERRRFGAQPPDEGCDALRRSLDLDGDTIGRIPDEAGQALFRGQAVGKGTEADAL